MSKFLESEYISGLSKIEEALSRNKKFNCDEVKDRWCDLASHGAKIDGLTFDRETILNSLNEKFPVWDEVIGKLKDKGYILALGTPNDKLVYNLRGQEGVYKNDVVNNLEGSGAIEFKKERILKSKIGILPFKRKIKVCLYKKTPIFENFWR